MFKASIIIPMYNAESFFDDCMNSILRQTIGFENLQVIIVDDKSTDKSVRKITRFHTWWFEWV